jgi:hypothetical protein
MRPTMQLNRDRFEEQHGTKQNYVSFLWVSFSEQEDNLKMAVMMNGEDGTTCPY